MKTSRLVLMPLLGLFLLAACTKENGLIHPVPPAGADTTGNKGSGSNSDSTYVGTLTWNYQPDSVGSSWSYQVNQVFNISQSTLAQLDPAAAALFSGLNIDTTVVYHVQALGTSSVVGGLTFMNFSNDYGGGFFNPAVAIAGGNYTGVNVLWEPIWVAGSGFGGFTLNIDTLLYLEVQAAGTSWNETTVVQDAYGYTDTTNYSFTVKDTGMTRGVNGITYPHVIQVESKVLPSALASYAALFASSGYDLYTVTECYYAENVGLIEEDLSDSFMGVSLTAQLQASTIK